jgi:hypothetical protein
MAKGKIFTGSRGIEIRFHVDQDISAAIEMKVYYWLPESESGGYIDAEAEGLGTIYAVLEEVGEIGRYFFQGWVRLTTSKVLFTEVLPYEFFEPLSNRIT